MCPSGRHARRPIVGSEASGVLEFDGAIKRFGPVAALDGCTFAARPVPRRALIATGASPPARQVLLARIPARNLLAGKVAGIGLIGLPQIGVTALVAVTATAGSADLPAARGSVLAWAVVWFVLGYALYATAYGALGSLASRTEDAQSVAGPGDGRADRGLLLLFFPCRRATRQRHGQAGFVLPGDRATGHAQPHRYGRDRLVGAGGRRRAYPGRRRSPGAVRRACLRRRPTRCSRVGLAIDFADGHLD